MAEQEIISHWFTLVDGLKQSSKDFYTAVQEGIEARKMPKVKVSRVEIAQGGPLSAKRLYLRVRRNEHTFDICGAPFGEGFFISWWLFAQPGCLAQIPGVGWIFRRFVAPVTYYSIDTALMFQSGIHTSVLETLDNITKAEGLRELSDLDRKPILRDFWKR